MNANLKRNVYTYIYSGTIYNNQDVETNQVPQNKGENQEDVAYVHGGILLSCQKDNWRKESIKNMSFAVAWLELEKSMLSEIS